MPCTVVQGIFVDYNIYQRNVILSEVKNLKNTQRKVLHFTFSRNLWISAPPFQAAPLHRHSVP